MSFQEFIEMGGYGGYIWSSYGIALIIFGGLFVNVKLQQKKLINQLRRRYLLKQQQQNNQSIK